MTRTKVSVVLYFLFIDVILKHTHNSATRATKPICSRKMSKAVCFLRFTYDKAQETITMIFKLRHVLFFSLKKYEGILKVFNYPSLLTRKHHLHHLHRTSTTTCYFTKLPTNMFLLQIWSKHHHSHPTNLAETRQMAPLGKDLLIRCLIPEVWELGHPKH